jgi:hypothetical protein
MKNKVVGSLAVILLVLSLFQITINITPIVFSGESTTRREIWQIVNVTNTHESMTTMGDVKVAVGNRTGVNIAWSTNITKYYWNESGSILGYNTYMEWLNGTNTLPYHWGEMDWYVSEGSLTSITWDEIKYWWDMYRDTGGGVNYTTFMGNTYMADCNVTDPTNDPDIIRYNQTQVGVPWIGSNITIKDLEVPAKTSIYLVLKIVITEPGIYLFNLTSPNPLFTISPSTLRFGGAMTILVPDEYTTIQAAVNAASPGNTIIVYDGVYDEQVVINKSLTIQGIGNTTIKPSSAKLTQVFDGLFWYGGTKNIAGIIVANVPDGSNVTIKNLKVDESLVTTKPAGADYLTGIFYRETGGTIDTVNIVGTGAWSGGDRAYGIYLSAATNTASVQITGSTITNWDKNAIETMGNKLTFNIHHNVLTGRGPTLAGDEVQNGINAGRGSVGTVNNNVISNMSYTPETWWSAGIMFYDYVFNEYGRGSVAGNTITDCQIGVIFINCNGTAQGNTVNGGTVGLIGLSSEPEQGGAWTASFVNNTVTGVRNSPAYPDEQNGAIDSQTFNAGAYLTVTIDNNQLIGGGSTNADGVYIDGSAGTVTTAIRGNVISGWQNGTHLVNLVGVGSSISGNTIANNTVGIQVEAAVNATNILANNNNIYGNVLYGVRNLNSSTLNAKYSWWGNETGPYNPTLNPNGKGDNASDNVDFKPWAIQPYPPMVPVSELYVDPQLTQCWTGLNKTFQVKVKLDNVKLLYGFEFKLRWNSTLLNLTSATYSSLWTDTYLWQHVWDNSIAEYRLALSARGNVSAFTGNATLATLTFVILYEPLYPNNVTSNLGLVDTLLSRSQNLTVAEPIVHLAYNGTYMCNYTLPKIMLAQPEYVVKRVPKDFDVNVTVTYVINLEAFNFTLTYDPNLLILLYNDSRILLGTSGGISWNNGSVSGYARGITPPVNGTATLATIRFRALGVVWNTVNGSGSCALAFSYTNLTEPGGAPIEHVAVNGTYVYKPVPGDLDMSGKVDISDLAAVARAFGAKYNATDGKYWHDPPCTKCPHLPILDVKVDGVINILDIVLIARNYLREEPEP